MRQIKIIKCSSTKYWYNNHINEIFDYAGENKLNFLIYSSNPIFYICEAEPNYGYVVKTDAIELNRSEKIENILKKIENQ